MARRLLVAATLLVTLLAAREASRGGGRTGRGDTVLAAMMSARSVAASYARLPAAGVAVLTAPAVAAAR
jgi:hypothetical protein